MNKPSQNSRLTCAVSIRGTHKFNIGYADDTCKFCGLTVREITKLRKQTMTLNTKSLTREEWFRNIPQYAQRQDSTSEQMRDLIQAANRLGLYDAADWVKQNYFLKRD